MPVFFGHMKEEMPLTLREEAPMTKDDARRLNPLQLAYIGDTVYDLLTRSRLLYRGIICITAIRRRSRSSMRTHRRRL